MVKDDTVAGIILGVLGLALLAKLGEKKCPICNSSIPVWKTECPNCGYVN